MSAHSTVTVQLIHMAIPSNQENAHIIEALHSLGFTGKVQVVDMIAYEEKIWYADAQAVDLGLASQVDLADLAEKLSVFQSVPVTSNDSTVYFTIEDFWG